jgi:hypothetical protein
MQHVSDTISSASSSRIPQLPEARNSDGHLWELVDHWSRKERPAMTIRIAAIVLLLTLAATAQTTPPTDKSQQSAFSTEKPQAKQGQVPPAMLKMVGNFGGWWNALSDEDKNTFLDGFLTAMRRAQTYTGQACVDRGKEPAKPPGPQFDAQMQEIFAWCAVLNLSYNSARATSCNPRILVPLQGLR